MRNIEYLLPIVLLGWITTRIDALLSNQHPSHQYQQQSPYRLFKSKTNQFHQIRLQPLFLSPQQLGTFDVLEPTFIEPTTSRRVRLYYRGLEKEEEPIPFETGWDWQRDCLNQHVQRLAQSTNKKNNQEFDVTTSCSQFLQLSNDIDDDNEATTTKEKNGIDTVYMLQHSPVYTLGTGSDEAFILQNTNKNNNNENIVPTVRMDRGGEVTYHGPGQLTVYPILDLRSYKQDIHWYMRALEEAIIIALTKCGLKNAIRQDDITGVWVDNHKVAAVGIKCRKWITMHGIAINVEECSLSNFNGIVPCGLEGRKVGCINQLLLEQYKEKQKTNSNVDLSPPKLLTVAEFAEYIKDALEEVFQIELISEDR